MVFPVSSLARSLGRALCRDDHDDNREMNYDCESSRHFFRCTTLLKATLVSLVVENRGPFQDRCLHWELD